MKTGSEITLSSDNLLPKELLLLIVFVPHSHVDGDGKNRQDDRVETR